MPVALGRPGDDRASHVELVGEAPRTLTFEDCNRPIKANYGDVGYYRVRYDDECSESAGVGSSPAFGGRSGQPHCGCLGHGVAGLDAPAAYLDLTKRLSNETELAVWDGVIGNLRFIDDQYADLPQREGFREYARSSAEGRVQPSGMGAATGRTI